MLARLSQSTTYTAEEEFQVELATRQCVSWCRLNQKYLIIDLLQFE